MTHTDPAPPAATARTGHVVECDPCRLYSTERLTYAAAEETAGQHDDNRHHGALTAYICPEER